MAQINGCPRAAGLMLLQPFCQFIVKSFSASGSIDWVAFSIVSVGMITMMVFVVIVVVDWMVLLLLLVVVVVVMMLLMEMVNRSGGEPPGPPHVECPSGRAFIP